MKTEHTHTPLPWHLRGDTVLVSPGLQICQMDRCNKHPATAVANGKFIVAACNSHDELLAALERLLACSQPTGMDTETDRAMEQARASIAKATGTGRDVEILQAAIGAMNQRV